MTDKDEVMPTTFSREDEEVSRNSASRSDRRIDYLITVTDQMKITLTTNPESPTKSDDASDDSRCVSVDNVPFVLSASQPIEVSHVPIAGYLLDGLSFESGALIINDTGEDLMLLHVEEYDYDVVMSQDDERRVVGAYRVVRADINNNVEDIGDLKDEASAANKDDIVIHLVEQVISIHDELEIVGPLLAYVHSISPQPNEDEDEQTEDSNDGGTRDSQILDMNPSLHHVLNQLCEAVHQEMAGNSRENNSKEIDWTVKVEILFFYALIGHKPVGINRHFMMLLIHNKFSNYIGHDVSSKALWKHLDSMYDMAALHESEVTPFPNDEVDFELPEDCHDLLQAKYGVSLDKSNSESESNKNNSNSSKSSKKLTPKLKPGSSTSTPKNNFASPVLSKPLKSQTSVKIEKKTATSDATPKSKDLGLSAKISKVKRSSSPITNKPVKSETATKEESSDKKSHKSGRGSSPAIVKKPIKSDSPATNSSLKKVTKSESSSANGSKAAKVETPDSSVKKDKKTDKDILSKKTKMSSSSADAVKKPKVDVAVLKKKTESESSSRKSSGSSSHKSVKSDVKHSSHSSREAETPTSGSRKSSPVVKVKGSESGRKPGRPKVEESSKKSTPVSKRRRL